MASRKLFSLWTPVSEAEGDRARSRFHAVEIHCRPNGCTAAQNLLGKRFLCADAPMLPLAECDRQPYCECYYCHYSDRRCGTRRYDESGEPLPAEQRPVDERKVVGRRAEDRAPAGGGPEPSSLADTYYDYVAEKLRD